MTAEKQTGTGSGQEKRVLSASTARWAFFFIGSLVILAWGLYEVIQDPSIDMQVAEPPAQWLAVLFAGPAALFFYVTHRKKLPRIILDENGIVHEHLFKRMTWRWDDIGPFALDSVHIPKSHQLNYFACAYTTEHRARIFERSGFRPEADYSKSDIVIPLDGMQDGDDLNSPEDIVGLFNDWRMRFQTPNQLQDDEASTSPANSIWS